MGKFLKNPLIPGFYPDPSVCRKGHDYYLVTSTFEYFPGIPVFHSVDFVHWNQIGHVLDRPEQLNLDGVKSSKGIYASSIFYHEETDRFYVITTLVGNDGYLDNVNFYVWADKPEGPWSEPVVVKGAEGIDPSLVFDRGKTYYLGNRRPYPEQPERGRHIWIQEMNLKTGELTGERHTLLTQGALTNAAAPEGPHIYHIGDWYYLLIAEGGTFRNHASTIFRSRELTGPYESDPRNPLITHRNLRGDYPIKNPGHADMIRLHNGEWWAVLLATRPVGGDYGNLGRETYTVPVTWENEWPLFSPNTGHVEFSYPAPKLDEDGVIGSSDREFARESVLESGYEWFDIKKLPFSWITVRTPRYQIYSLTERPGYLRIYLHENTLKDTASCSFLGRRQQHMCFEAATVMEFEPVNHGEAGGMVLRMNENYHIRMEYGLFGGDREVRLTKCFAGKDDVLSRRLWEKRRTYFKIVAEYQEFDFYISNDEKTWEVLAEHVDGTLLSREVAGGYTGTVLGLYASSNGRESKNAADFGWFSYQEHKRQD